MDPIKEDPHLCLLLQPGFQAAPVSCSAAGAVLRLPQARLQGRGGLLSGLRLRPEAGDRALQLLRLAARLLLTRRRALLGSRKALQAGQFFSLDVLAGPIMAPDGSLLLHNPAVLPVA